MFRPVRVFDASQTDGKPLPELASSLSGTVPHYEAFLEAVRRSAPVPIEFEPMAENMDGYFSSEQQRIALREGMSEVQTISAAVHETAHSKLHDPKKYEAEPTWKIVMVSEGGTKHDFRQDFATEAEAEQAAAEEGWRYVDENQFEWRLEVEEDLTAVKQAAKNRNTEEVEAESISYAVCQYFGIQTGENSFDTADLDAHDGIFALPREEWEESPEFDKLVKDRMDHQEEREQAFLYHKGDCFAIYQVKHTDELRDIRYEGLEWLQSIGRTVQRDTPPTEPAVPTPTRFWRTA